MRDIVATIQADQYRLITRDPDGVLVIQGGPGTGKTAVGLHRASWLVYTLGERLQRRGVLVVGPNRTFMEYVSHVLPALGEDMVEQRAVSELVDGIVPERRDPPDVAELKADTRLAEVVRRAAELQLVSQPQELVLRLEGSFVWVKEREVGELVERAREELGTGAAARERFRMSLLRRFYEEYGRIHGAGAVRSFDEVERALRAKGYLDRVLKAAWPSVAPDRLVQRLLTSRALLAEAADGILDDAEQRVLQRRGAGWSDGDVALLDEARTALVEPPHAYGHVIVDEAQDLTPMQLRMVARRARDGAFTALGDVAQATGPVRYSTLGRGAAAPAARRRSERRGAPSRLSRASRDHGARAAAARAHRARRRAADRLPDRRSAAGGPPRRGGASARRGLPRGRAAAPDGLTAVIVPERARRERAVRRARAGAHAARGERARVRPRRRGRAGADPATRALRRAHAADEDARRPARARPAAVS